MVLAYVSYRHEWVRGQIRLLLGESRFIVWCVDYGYIKMLFY